MRQRLGRSTFAAALVSCTLPALVFASGCDEVDGDAARLACYDRLAECASIDDSEQRLRCFEDPSGAVQSASRAPPLRPDSTPPAAPPAAVSDRIPAAPAEAPETAPMRAEQPPTGPNGSASAAADARAEDPFPVKGRPSSAPDAEEPRLEAVIERVRRDPRGIVYLFLDNGQVWRETARSKFGYQAGMAVTVTTGALGSTNLRAEGMKKFAKVRRVE